MFAKIGPVTAMLLFGAANVYPQSVPVSAKMRLTTEIAVNGKIELTHVQEGLFYRASSGSQIQQWTKRDGKDVVGDMCWAGLNDREHGRAYKVDYQNRRAYEQPMPATGPPEPPGSNASPKGLAEDSVEGIPCARRPVRLILPGKPPAEVGYSCFADKYDELELKREMTFVQPSGKTSHTIFELYEIRLNVEPDQKLFDLKGFTVFRPDSDQQR